MLLVRKLVGSKIGKHLKDTLGREPTEEEVRVAVRKRVGRRGEQIAFKGWKDFGKRNYSTDEELVVTAVLAAIVTGRESLILTWDTDLQEQFVKLMMLLASDYEAYFFAEHAASGVQSIPWRRIPLSSEEQHSLHTTSNGLQYVGCPSEAVEKLLPNPYRQVNCYCCVLGNNRHDLKVTTTIFPAESEMSWILETKARTGGRNTDRFGTLNIHGGVMMRGERPFKMFTLLNDKYEEFMGVHIAEWDLEHALMTSEPFEKRYI